MTVLLRLLLVSFLAVPVLVVGTAPPAAACSCEQVDPAAPRQWGEDVFVATLLADLAPSGDGEVAAVASVTHLYRGDAPYEVTVVTASDGDACGAVGLGAGDALLFSTSLDGDVVGASSCGGPAVADEAAIAEVEADLGPGEDVTRPTGALPPESRDGDRAAGAGDGDGAESRELLAAGGFAVLVLVIGGVVRLVRTRGPAPRA